MAAAEVSDSESESRQPSLPEVLFSIPVLSWHKILRVSDLPSARISAKRTVPCQRMDLLSLPSLS